MHLTTGPEMKAMDPFFTSSMTKYGHAEELLIHCESLHFKINHLPHLVNMNILSAGQCLD